MEVFSSFTVSGSVFEARPLMSLLPSLLSRMPCYEALNIAWGMVGVGGAATLPLNGQSIGGSSNVEVLPSDPCS